MGRHAKYRAIQRYNVDLKWSDEKNIISKLKSGKGYPLPIENVELKEGEDPVEFAYVIHRDIPLKICYSTSKETGLPQKIITIYPFEADEYNEAVEIDLKNHINKAVNFLKANGYIVYKRKKK